MHPRPNDIPHWNQNQQLEDRPEQEPPSDQKERNWTQKNQIWKNHWPLQHNRWESEQVQEKAPELAH